MSAKASTPRFLSLPPELHLSIFDAVTESYSTLFHTNSLPPFFDQSPLYTCITTIFPLLYALLPHQPSARLSQKHAAPTFSMPSSRSKIHNLYNHAAQRFIIRALHGIPPEFASVNMNLVDLERLKGALQIVDFTVLGSTSFFTQLFGFSVTRESDLLMSMCGFRSTAGVEMDGFRSAVEYCFMQILSLQAELGSGLLSYTNELEVDEECCNVSVAAMVSLWTGFWRVWDSGEMEDEAVRRAQRAEELLSRATEMIEEKLLLDGRLSLQDREAKLAAITGNMGAAFGKGRLALKTEYLEEVLLELAEKHEQRDFCNVIENRRRMRRKERKGSFGPEEACPIPSKRLKTK
ncbi:hypothetical protein BJ508DRAFT_377965 [Ascobolus immersus RN42]|uniref:Uncharacterized protein n=1 Tax=Ascobolus immersus RN42 TaxID=1160509 RepID=A0A3N4I2Y8_ASCIM|nr:hypothetical protein BJ508DRAFT_377965 [Ascobolus immersus RN42]